MTGSSLGSGTDFDYTTIKYSSLTTTAPVLTVSNLTVVAALYQCSAAVELTATATGTPTPTITYALVSTPITSPYSFPVRVTTETFTVTVPDQQALMVRTQPVSIALVNGTATLTASQINNSSSDNCSGTLTYTLSQTTFTCANMGSNTVRLTITDASGNQSTAPAQVTVTGSVPTVPPIQVTPATLVYTGGVAITLYLGYGSQSMTLTASGDGTYRWDGPSGLNSLASAAPVFTATRAGTFTYSLIVTSASGCPAPPVSVTLTVVEAHCSSNGKKTDKVPVCHNGKLLCVSKKPPHTCSTATRWVLVPPTARR